MRYSIAVSNDVCSKHCQWMNLLHKHYPHLALRDPPPTLCLLAWAKPPMTGAQWVKRGFLATKKIQSWTLPLQLSSSRDEINRKKHQESKHRFKLAKATDQVRQIYLYCNTSSIGHACPMLSGPDTLISDLLGNFSDNVVHQSLPSPMEPILSILQAVKRYYSRAVNYGTYHQASKPHAKTKPCQARSPTRGTKLSRS